MSTVLPQCKCWVLPPPIESPRPKREWQGLTDEDDVWAMWESVASMEKKGADLVLDFARAIEAKLKEKNG